MTNPTVRAHDLRRAAENHPHSVDQLIAIYTQASEPGNEARDLTAATETWLQHAYHNMAQHYHNTSYVRFPCTCAHLDEHPNDTRHHNAVTEALTLLAKCDEFSDDTPEIHLIADSCHNPHHNNLTGLQQLATAALREAIAPIACTLTTDKTHLGSLPIGGHLG